MGWTSTASSVQQLLPLQAACDGSVHVRVRMLAAGPDDSTIYTRFLSLQSNSVLLYWPTRSALEFAQSGKPVECYFEHERTRYAFFASTQGRIIHVLPNETRAVALRLERPETIEKRQQREAFRVPLCDLPPIHMDLVELRSDGERGCVLCAQLINISASGIGAVSDCPRALIPQRRSVCRADFRLPGVTETLRVALELVHFRQIPDQQDRWYLGWRFCPSEDVRVAREQQRRLEKFIAERQRDRARQTAH